LRETDFVHLDSALEHRLFEWKRWAKARGWSSSGCRSAENRYRPEAGDVFEQEPRGLPINALDAWRIECAWRTGLPLKERLLLRAYFITAPVGSLGGWERHVRTTCRELAIPRHEFPSRVTSAIRMLENRLVRDERRADSLLKQDGCKT
jgi:hypothetical protein